MPGFSSKLYCVVIILSTNITRLVSIVFTLLRLIPAIFCIRKSINSAGSLTLYTVYFATARATGLPDLLFLPLDIIIFFQVKPHSLHDVYEGTYLPVERQPLYI